MSLDIPINITGIVQEKTETSRTYALDLEKGRIAGMVDGLEATDQFIKKAILTPRFKCLIYDNQYGSELKDRIMDADADREFIETEIPRLVKDALLNDTRVLDTYDFVFDFEVGKENAYIKFKADTIYGTIEIEEVI